MNQINKSVLSTLTIIAFLLLAYASVPSDSGFPEDKCESKHSVNFDGKIELLVIDKVTSEPIPGVSVNIHYSCFYGRFEEISGSIEYECKKVDDCFTYPFKDATTDEAGKINIEISARTYSTDLDGTRIGISLYKEGYEDKYLSFYRNHEDASSIVTTIALLNKELL